MCMICKGKEETRYIDLYVFGSEGLRICHGCEMKLVEYARNLRRDNMRLPPQPIDDLDDPLEVLITWSYSVREKVAQALKPLVYLQTPDGLLTAYNPIDDDDLRDKVFNLAYAVQYELGLRKDYRLRTEEAEQLANEILSTLTN